MWGHLPSFSLDLAALLTPAAASAAGLTLGVVVAVVLSFCFRQHSQQKQASGATQPIPRVSRQTRAALLLAGIGAASEAAKRTEKGAAAATASQSKTTAASATDVPQASPNDGDSEHWETDSEEEDEETDSEEEDIPESELSEYERMESMRLKMVFVVRQLTPKLPANTVAELTAGAGVGLVEWLSSLPTKDTTSVPNAYAKEWASHGCLVTSDQDDEAERTQWRTWYAWWNRIGCAKIALKCSDEDVMEAVVASAVLNRIPLYLMRKSHIATTAQASQEAARSKEKGSRTRAVVPETEAASRCGDPRELCTSNDVVVVVLGPAPAATLDPITGSLKLFN